MPDMGQRLPCRQTTKQPARTETDIFRAGRLNEFVNNLHKSNTALQGILFWARDCVCQRIPVAALFFAGLPCRLLQILP